VSNATEQLLDSLFVPIPTKTAPDVWDWAENNFYLYDTGKLMSLYDCQRRPLELAFSKDESGRFKYHTILWSMPKKSAKSSVIAAVWDYKAEHQERASLKLIGNDLKQADSRVGFYIRENIKLAQRQGKRSGIKLNPSGYKIEYPNGSRIEMIPIDPSGEAGGNDDAICFSELWGWRSDAHQRMFSEMTISPNKFGYAQRWIDTYAGFKGGSPILEALYDTAVTNGVRVWDDLEVYVNDRAGTMAVWYTQPMFPWQTQEYYQQEASILTPAAFARMHRNQWVSAEYAFIPIEWWDGCQGEVPELGKFESMVVGIDAAVTHDCFAIVGVTRIEETCYVRYVNVWTPPPGGRIDFAEPEAELRRLANRYNVNEFAYDPTQLEDMMMRLRKEGIGGNFRPFSQGADRFVADKGLYDRIGGRRIRHNGEPVLREHLANADAEPDKEGRKLRIVKREVSGKPIDAAVALSMAVARAYYLNIG